MKRLALVVALLFSTIAGVSNPISVQAAGTCSSWFTSSTSARAKCTNYPIGYTRVRVILTCRTNYGLEQYHAGPWVLANSYYSSSANCYSGSYAIRHTYGLK